MPREILTHPISKAATWQELEFLVDTLAQLGQLELKASFGFAWGLIIVALTALGCRSVGVEPPSGYRVPTKADYIGDWQVTSASKRPPIHVKADFDGDQLPDEAWILLNQSGPSWGLFVFLGTADGWSQAIELDTDNGDIPPQSMGISVVPPGRYETACGKGYGPECKPDEPEWLTTAKPAIDFFMSEGANSFFWWDDRAKAFRRTWMSD